jgi:hypothetical protein
MGKIMLNLVKIYSSSVDSFKRRIVKFLLYGKNDVRESIFISPYGVDSNPIKDMIALYGSTDEKGSSVIIGYINKNSIAGPGELRLFSTDGSGLEKSYAWLKADGSVEINGSTDNFVRYTALDSNLQLQVTAINAELVKIAAGIVAGGGAYTPTFISLDISGSKINTVKTSL